MAVDVLPSLADSRRAVPDFRKKQVEAVEEYEAPSTLEKGAVCAICYEPLLNESPLLKCSAVCFNFFHTKCLRFWIDYQWKEELQASCPMCRGKLPHNIIDRLKQA